ncbi:mechanosensitive ion channel protein MscS [bacterium DOLZORAL124_64_63]|nr:MAG: mechanosensitive ion channel protein MscS [bacterium DOLZORAL124_64_63]
MPEFINADMHALLAKPLWRAAIIIGCALVVWAVLRLGLVPVLRRLDDRIVGNIHKALARLIVLQTAHLLLLDLLKAGKPRTVLLSVYLTLLVLIVGKALLDIAMLVFQRLSRSTGKYTWIQPSTLPLYKFVLKFFLFGAQAYLIMSAWRVDLTSWLASAGVMGIAVGFASKDTLANFIAGVFILMDAPYRVGQFIHVEGQVRGVVTDIGMRSTRVLTRDNVEVTVPNGVIGNSMIINETGGPSDRMRLRVDVGVAYGSDVDHVKQVLTQAVEGTDHLDPTQPVQVRFVSMGASSLDFQVLVWVLNPQYRGRVLDALNTRFYKALVREGIDIPFPQRDLYIKQMPEAARPAAPPEG